MFSGKILILLLVTIVGAYGNDEQYHCVWYGVCYIDEHDHSLNCPYYGEGKKLEDQSARETLLELCPNVYTGRKSLTHNKNSYQLAT